MITAFYTLRFWAAFQAKDQARLFQHNRLTPGIYSFFLTILKNGCGLEKMNTDEFLYTGKVKSIRSATGCCNATK